MTGSAGVTRDQAAQAGAGVVSTVQSAGAGGREYPVLQTAGAGENEHSVIDSAGSGGMAPESCAEACINGVPSLVTTIGIALGLCTEEEVIGLLSEALAIRADFGLLAMDPGKDYASAASRLIAPGWTLRDHPPLPLTPPVDWGTADQGDGNWHYRLNSLGPAMPFLAAAIAQASEDHFDHMRALAIDWIQFNMVCNEPNEKKWYNQAVGYRAHYLAVLLRELLRRQPTDTEGIRAIVWALIEHGRWLADPEHTTASNHWLYMMLGLRSIWSVLPETAETRAWGAYAIDGAVDYIDERVSSEGISLEHSPGYHEYVASTLTSLTNTGLFGQALEARTEQMLSQLVWMVNPSEEFVNIGDSAGTYSPGLSSTADFAASDGTSGEEPPMAPVGFPEAGVAVLRSPWSEHPYQSHSFVYFMAAFHSTVHKHADHLTFEWNDLGVPIVVDSGKYSYDAGPWRTFFMSTRSSNTVEIDGMDYSLSHSCEFGSALRDWGSTPSGLQYVAGSLEHCGLDVSHGRVIVLRPHRWLLVTDWLDGKTTPHVYRQWFGFHESAELQSLDAQSLVMRLGNGEELYVQAVGGATSIEHARGREEPDIQGWISHDYQERTPRESVAFVADADRTVLMALMTLSEPAEELQFENTEAQVSIQFALGTDDSERLVLRTDGSPTVAEQLQ